MNMEIVGTYRMNVAVPLAADSAEQAIRTLSESLIEMGWVLPSFTQAVLDREEIFPTGLPTPGIHVAIPHTDPEHALESAIALGILEKPVAFGEMGNPDSTLDIQLICMLAVTKTDSFVILLQNLIKVFQDTDFLNQIVNSKDPQETIRIFQERIPEI